MTPVVDSSGPFASFNVNPSINDTGAVSFAAFLDSLASGVFVASGGIITTVADTTGGFAPFFGGIAPQQNIAGTTLFMGFLPGGSIGIYSGPDPAADAILKTGDLLLGSPIEFALLSGQALNESNAFVFHAQFADGRQGIFRADPVPDGVVPEPGTAMLLMVGLVGLGLGRQRRSVP